MKTKFTLKHVIFTLAFVCVYTVNAQIYVDNNTGANAAFSDLQAAIDAASPNDVIYVQPSQNSYGRFITINKPLTIVGRSHSEDNNSSIVGKVTINHLGSGTTLKGLRIGNEGIETRGQNETSTPGSTDYLPKVFVTNIAILNCNVDGINFTHLNIDPSTNNGRTQGTGASNVLIRGSFIRGVYGFVTNLSLQNNILYGFGGNTLSVYSPSTSVISNNLFIGATILRMSNSQGIIQVQNSIFIVNNNSDVFLEPLNINFTNCLTYNYGSGNYNISSDSNSNSTYSNILLNVDPLFNSTVPTELFSSLGVIKNDFALQTGSPAIGAGINGEDLGIFGGGFNFSNVGVPAGYPTVNIVSSTASLPQNGSLKVTLTAKAQ